MYCKLITETRIEYAPKTVRYEDKLICNPSDDVYVALGYMPLVKATPPSEEGYYYTPLYAVENNTVVQSWEAHEVEISESEQKAEAYDYLMEGSAEDE